MKEEQKGDRSIFKGEQLFVQQNKSVPFLLQVNLALHTLELEGEPQSTLW